MSDELVAVRVYPSTVEANLAKSQLDAEEIFCAVFTDDAGGMEPQLQLTQGVRLMVKQSDLTRAEAILSE